MAKKAKEQVKDTDVPKTVKSKQKISELKPVSKPNTFKVSKIQMWPSRKINLGNFNSCELNAGMEVVFDTPVDINSDELKSAQEQVRNVIRQEFIEQYRPYAKMLQKNKVAKGGE